MVGVAEDELELGGQRAVVDGFERGVGGDGDEARGVHDAVGGVQAADAGAGASGAMNELVAEGGRGFVGGEGGGGWGERVRVGERGGFAAAVWAGLWR